MPTDIDITIFKEFARLEDPYECARHIAKLNLIQPYKKPVYAGRFNPVEADTPIGPTPSTTICLTEALEPYELLRLDTENKGPYVPPARITFPTNRSVEPVKSQSSMKARSVADKHGKWDAYVYQYKRDKALKCDAETPVVPKCLPWTVEDVLVWLGHIGMGKYEETFLANEVDGSRLCDLDKNRLVKMGVQAWDDLKVFSKEIKLLTNLPSRKWFYSRETSLPPMDKIDLYLEFKNEHGEHSETTSYAQFTELHRDTLWSYPEKTLRYPGMIYQNNHQKQISTALRF